MSKKKLLVYYSFSGNIESLIPMFSKHLNIDIARLQVVIPYPIELEEFNKRYHVEMNNKLLPKYRKLDIKIEDYQTIILVLPNWGDTFPPVVRTFLSNNSFKGKTFVPIISFGRNRESNIVNEIIVYAPGSKVTKALVFEENHLKEEDLKTFIKEVY
ncbi:flavodoxin [Candidatus Izemoplasma sp. B36]|uniref:flavodoxin n=1 Tax=Candidatus Izemoplasma sp. B36 TaxID=3242468 RepID=UPI003558F8C6